ncbi:neuronal PAS domain-containing protein 2-like [Clytia hemisphaerica]|uniref:Uncharacterized protein n=1 Tax=Clytia hemisphaerica TaxID=252671 RepID=A0A7M5X1H8_9CNID
MTSIMGSQSNASSITSSEDNSSAESSKERLLKSRCKSEKKRRDKLNSFIQSLQAMLAPDATKRLDKLTVLKMTLNYLSLHNDFSINVSGQGAGKNKKTFFIPCDELGQLMFEATNGFILVINDDAKLLYIADVAEKILGIKASNITGKPIHAFIHEDDRTKVAEEIMSSTYFDHSTESTYMDFLGENIDVEKRCITLDFRVKVSDSDRESSYRHLSCVGRWQSFKKLEESGFLSKVLILFATVKTEMREIAPPEDAIPSFMTKQGLDLSFIFVDQNCPPVTGYTSYELLGKSLYMFVHVDDLPEIHSAHDNLTKNRCKEVQTFFRFCSKGEEWLLLKVVMQMKSSEGTMQPDFISMCFYMANQEEILAFRENAMVKSNETLRILKKTNDGLSDKKPVSLVHQQAAPGANEEVQKMDSDTKGDLLPQESTSEGDPQSEKDEEKEIEQTLEIQQLLHSQLTDKHKSLAESFVKQERQLERINKIMTEYKAKMEDPAFKAHFSEQLEMFDYFKYLLKKHKRQQDYLQKQVRGKVKDLELRARAVKLRNMVSHQQKVLKDIRIRRKNEDDPTEYGNGGNKSGKNPEVVQPEVNVELDDEQPRSNASAFAESCQRLSISTGLSVTTESPLTSPSFAPVSNASSSMSNMNTELRFSQELSPSTHYQRVASETQCSNQNENAQQLAYLLQRSQSKPETPNPLQRQQSQIDPNNQSETRQPQHTQFLESQQLLTQQLAQLQQQDQMNSAQQQQSVSQVLNSASLEKSLQFFQQSFQDQQNTIQGDTSDLQKFISKQILVHLQVLQKHVLTQLVNVMQDKSQNLTNFSQVLPVLQQLQQLQQSILDQQSENREKTPENMNAPEMGEQLLNAQQGAVGGETKTPEEANDPSRVFDGSCFKELNDIKRTLAYNENSEQNNDCFPEVSSPDLQALLSGTDKCLNDGMEKLSDDPKKDPKKVDETEELSYAQPFLENQQQLLQLQQYQRMQIYMQQRQQLEQLVQSQNGSRDTVAPTQQQQQQQPQQQQAQQLQTQQLQNQQQNNPLLRPMANMPNLNEFGDQQNQNLIDFGTFDTSWLSGENEEVLNMLLSENDHLWN